MNEVQEVKARLDIVDVIGQYVQLQKAGRSFKAICPFHSERTPSFIVSPERQSWHCFGACGTGGDVIGFVMRKEGLEFPEALRMLAQRAGVSLPERRVPREEDRTRERLRAANEAAADWYRQLLLGTEQGRGAREYLERRGIDGPTAEAFCLGYSPSAWEATRERLRQGGFTDAELLAAGLLVEGESGPHDRFRGRLMFPIRDLRGRVIGFGARALDDGPSTGSGQALPKYLNTSQTPVFEKGGVLYALERAQDGIRREGRAVIVEGYMDAIAAHQHGFDNVVASMGTALTERQASLLKRYSPKVVVALDADIAGGEATLRALSLHLEMGTRAEPFNPSPDRASEEEFQRDILRIQQGIVAGNVEVDVAVAALPAGKDPDELIRESPGVWREAVSAAKPLMDFWFDAAAGRRSLSEPKERSQLVRELLPVVAIVRDPVVQAHYLQRLSRLALVSERDLAAMLRASGRRRVRSDSIAAAAAAAGPSPPAGDAREEFLLALLLQYPDLRPEGLAIKEDLLWETENRELLAAWRRWEGPVLSRVEEEEKEEVKDALPQELRPHFQRLIGRRLPSFDLKQAREALLDSRQKLIERQLKAEKQATAALLAAWEEEVGASALAEATASFGALREDTVAVEEDERMQEVVSLHMRDMEAGLKLHRRERGDNSEDIRGTSTDG